MRIAWVTDPHLDFLHPMGCVRFGEWIAKSVKPDAVIVTGDIAEYPSLDTMLPGFAAGVKTPVYFVLGNHDLYRGSLALARTLARKMSQEYPNLFWLDEAGVIELAPEFALVGNGGWYDMRSGLGEKSKLDMSDFYQIEDLKNLGSLDRALKCRKMAKEMAEQATPILREAAAKYKNVFFATHVPPFREATWHQGKLSNEIWLPGFSNLTFGNMLSDAAFDFPETLFTVLCGHTHSEGVFTFKENMTVLTGHSEYSNPRVCKVFDLGKGNWEGATPQTPLAPAVRGMKEIPDRDDW